MQSDIQDDVIRLAMRNDASPGGQLCRQQAMGCLASLVLAAGRVYRTADLKNPALAIASTRALEACLPEFEADAMQVATRGPEPGPLPVFRKLWGALLNSLIFSRRSSARWSRLFRDLYCRLGAPQLVCRALAAAGLDVCAPGAEQQLEGYNMPTVLRHAASFFPA